MILKLTFWIWTGFLLRISNAIVNGFFGPSFGAGQDAIWFHMQAIEYSKNLVFNEYITGLIYPYILGVIYFLTTDHLFIGSVLSVLGWLVSAFILVRIMRILSFDMSIQWKAMFFYSILPSSVMYTSITIREPFQLLFVNLAIYAALKIYCQKSVIHWLTFAFSIAGMGVLHGALLATGVFILVSALLLLTYRSQKRFTLMKFFLITPLITLSLYYGFLLFTNFSYGLGGGLVALVQNYQDAVTSMGARSNYLTGIQVGDLGSLILYTPYFLFQYLFEPMPWKMTSLKDVIPLLENILRAWLIWNALKYFRAISRANPRFIENKPFGDWKLILFIFLSFLVMEGIWSLGTVNWGTSIRHHLPALGLLLVVGFSYKNLTLLKFNQSNNSPFIIDHKL